MGRPRQFIATVALSAAVDVFWKKGFEGASVTDLTTAMSITRPSLYAAFGNKEQLFLKVLRYYRTRYLSFFQKALEEPTARLVVESLLRGYANVSIGDVHPPGCLETNCSLAQSDEGALVRKELTALRAADEVALRRRLDRAVDELDLPFGSAPVELASYIMAVTQGMAVQAASGAPRETLDAVVRTVLVGWPVGCR